MAQDIVDSVDVPAGAKRPVEEGWELARPKKRKHLQSLGVDVNPGGTYCPTLADVQNLLLRIFTEQTRPQLLWLKLQQCSAREMQCSSCRRDIQNPIVFEQRYGENPRWLCIRGMNLVKCCRVVLLPCLESAVVLNRPASAPFLSSLLQGNHRVAMKTSGEVEHFPKDQGATDAGSRMLLSLLAARAKPTVAKKKQGQPKPATLPGASEPKPPIKDYLASEEARNRSSYPDRSRCSTPGWIELPDREREEGPPASEPAGDAEGSLDPDAKHLVAIDCEMVMTASGLALARVSLVGGDEVLYDTYVLPDEPITDYVTQYSGITKETLEGVDVKLSDVQKRLQELLSRQSILVGHSLESDLKALQLVHERVIDTVLLYPHPRGWPCRQSLAGLSNAILKRKMRREDGHDSIDDAKVSLELARLKFARGPSFGATGGTSVPLGRLLAESGVQLMISEGESAPAEQEGSHSSSWYEDGSKRVPLSELGRPRPKPSQQDGEADGSSQRSVHLVVLRSFERFCETAHALSGGSLEDGLPDRLTQIDRQAAQAAEGLSENDLLIVMNGCGNYQLLHKLLDAKGESAEQKRKVARARDKFKDTWGVFQCGGGALQQLLDASLTCAEAAPIQRELVSYEM